METLAAVQVFRLGLDWYVTSSHPALARQPPDRPDLLFKVERSLFIKPVTSPHRASDGTHLWTGGCGLSEACLVEFILPHLLRVEI